MSGPPSGRGAWRLLACASIFLALATLFLAWLLWRYVPLHAAMLEELGAPLPLTSRVIIAASEWFVRLLPFLLVIGVPAAGIGLTALVVVAGAIRPGDRIVRGVAALALAVALGETMVGGLIVFSIHSAQPTRQER